MKSYIVSFVLLYANSGTGMNNSSTYRYEPFFGIISGVEATERDPRYVVSIRVRKSHVCGGSIISLLWVLTAGHCIIDDDKYSVLYGTLKSSYNKSYGGLRNVVQKEIHPDFQKRGNIYIQDVGLLKVRRHFDSDRVSIVGLPEPFVPISYTKRALLLGWGRLQDDHTDIPINLQKIRIPVFPRQNCHLGPDLELGITQFCAGEHNRGPCEGDSGSPLSASEKQIGLGSWIFKPCGSEPGVFEAVSYYVDWINTIKKKYQDN